MQQKMAVLVLSYDGNSDMWDPFFTLFFRYWPDCPYPVYLTLNTKAYSHQGVRVISTGKPSSWSEELSKALAQIQEEKVFLFLEDYFIYEKVSNGEIAEIVKVMDAQKADFFRTGTFPARYRSLWPSRPLENHPGMNIVDPSARYLVNLQCGIWKKQTLEKLLVPGESPWEFEINGSKRFAGAGFLALGLDAYRKAAKVHGPVNYLCGALTRGVLMRAALRLAKREGIVLDTKSRRVETPAEELSRIIYIALPLPLRPVYLGIKRRISSVFTGWRKGANPGV